MIKLALLALPAAFAACGDDNTTTPPPAPGTFHVRLENIAPWTVLKSGVQPTRVDGAPGPAGPGEAFEVTFTGGKGVAVSFAAMFGESNDWFFAPDGRGIPLFDSTGRPASGDVTPLVSLWNAGTEIDQEPGVGDATAPRQPAPNTGPRDPDNRVRRVPAQITLADGRVFAVPAVAAMIRVTLTPTPPNTFTLRIANVSTPTTLVTSQGAMPIHVSPLAWAIHSVPDPLFIANTPARRDGLEHLAEDGVPDALGAALALDSGYATPLSPGVATAGMPLDQLGQRDFGDGLERIAEDGDPTALHAARPDTVLFDTPVGATAPRPAMPGEAFELDITGDRMTFATMFGMSNDWFFTTTAGGIALTEGDHSDEVVIVDLGTELDEDLAVGPDTASQQVAPNTGPADPDPTVRPADYDRDPREHVRLTITTLR